LFFYYIYNILLLYNTTISAQLAEVPLETHAPLIPIMALYHDRLYLIKEITSLVDYLKHYLTTQQWTSKSNF